MTVHKRVRGMVYTLLCLLWASPLGAFGESPFEMWKTDPSTLAVEQDPFIEEMLLRDRYSVRGHVAPGDKALLLESSYMTWYTEALAKAWADNQAQIQHWSDENREKVQRRDLALNSRFLIFHAYLEANPRVFGQSSKIEQRVTAQLSDELGNVYEAVEVRAGEDSGGWGIRGIPTLTLLFYAQDPRTGENLIATRRWLNVALLIDGSRYYFDFPVQGG